MAPESGELVKYLDEAIKSTRELTSELGSPVLYELGFKAAVESLAEQFEEKYGIKTDVSSAGRIPCPGESVELLLFKALKELLHNAAKHSGASRVVINISARSGGITVSVDDNGKGFRMKSAAREKGFGLFSIKERLVNFGGSLRVVSGKGRGASVRMEVPAAAGKGRAYGNKNTALRRS